MIQFNQILENLNNSTNICGKLKKLLTAQPIQNIINAIASLDINKKGYLTIQQIFKGQLDVCEYWETNFQKRISYSILASYLQSGQQNSFLNEDQLREINGTDIIKYMENYYYIGKYKEKALGSIGLYIDKSELLNSIKYNQFEQYCHSQKLPINPKTIFQILCQNKEQIQFNTKIQQPIYKNITIKETKHRVNMMNLNLQRLGQRIQKFAEEWF